MNQKAGSGKLSVMMLVLGIAALAMRWGLYATAVDAKGLLRRDQPLGIALMVLTACVVFRIALLVRKGKNADCCERYGTGGLAGAFGNVAAGAGILTTVLTGAPAMEGYLASAWRILGMAAPACLLLAGMLLVFGKRPFFLLHVVPSLFFLVHIVTRYQLWSAHPQMQDYVFALLGAMALMFFGFYTAALEADCGNSGMRLGMGLAAVYLCMAELARSSCPALYLGGILWVLTDLGRNRADSPDEV